MIAMKTGSVRNQMRDEGSGGRARSERRVMGGPEDRVGAGTRVRRGGEAT